MLNDFRIYDIKLIRQIATSMLKKLQKSKHQEFVGNGWFEGAGIVAVSLKLLYAFNDIDWDHKGIFALD